MKQIFLAGLLIIGLGQSMTLASAQESSATGGNVIGSVTLTRKVLADGQPLAPGTYQVRLSTEQPKPVVGQSPEGERYVEFVRAGKVAGREVATVISNQEMSGMGKYAMRPTNSSRVDTLRGDNYVRVWINKSGSNYLIHLPPAA